MSIFKSKEHTKKPLPVLPIIIGSSVLITAFLVAVMIIGRINLLEPLFKKNEKDNLVSLWQQSRYDEIVVASESILKKTPNDPVALAFRGFAKFYIGTTQSLQSDQIPYFNGAISDLRLAKLAGNKSLDPQINYILGKAYYYKGYYYHDLAIRYLELSLRQNFNNPDIDEYLGLCYFSRREWDKAIGYFSSAKKKKPGEFLDLTIAQTYKELHNTAEAKKIFESLVESASSVTIKLQALVEISRMSIDEGNFSLAQTTLDAALKLNENNADALYMKGLISENKGDAAMARDFWRKALKANPAHEKAAEKLKA